MEDLVDVLSNCEEGRGRTECMYGIIVPILLLCGIADKLRWQLPKLIWEQMCWRNVGWEMIVTVNVICDFSVGKLVNLYTQAWWVLIVSNSQWYYLYAISNNWKRFVLKFGISI